MPLSDFLPTFQESPYSYIFTSLIVVSSIIGFYWKPFFYALLLHPYEVAKGKRWHTVLTSAFIHRNAMHLAFNCIVIFGLAYDMYGCIKQEHGVESSMLITPFLIIILIILPNLTQVYLKRRQFEFTSIGSSGASFGLYGFSGMFFPLQKIDHLFIPWISNSAHYWLYILIVITMLSFVTVTRINRTLHLLAFILGSLLALIIRSEATSDFLRSF